MSSFKSLIVVVAFTTTIALLASCGDEEEVNNNDGAECTPMTCETLGYECGQHDDGCGTTIDCGECSDGEDCEEGMCVDTTEDPDPPGVHFVTTPDAETEQTSATFEFECYEGDCVSFQCALDTEQDDGDYQECSSPHTLQDLEPGEYTFRVEAANEQRDTDEATHSWEVVAGEQTDWIDAAIGSDHICAISSESQLYCWGDNEYGQLGDGTTEARSEPTPVGDEEWKKVVSTWNHTCGLQSDDTLWCWGEDGHGSLGDGSGEDSSTPVEVEPDWNWLDVSVGDYHSCGIRDDQTLWCWGSNYDGNLGDGTNEHSNTPVQAGDDDDWAKLSRDHGESHTCALRDDETLWCWGSNFYDALGTGDQQDSDVPVQSGTEDDWQMVASGLGHNCGVRSGGTLWCWGGYNPSGEMGQGDKSVVEQPAQVEVSVEFVSANAGHGHSCAVTSASEIWCWGSNSHGQIAQPTLGEGELSPVKVETELDFEEVFAGPVLTCGLTADEELWCWGTNESGQLGVDVTDERSATPSQLTR